MEILSSGSFSEEADNVEGIENKQGNRLGYFYDGEKLRLLSMHSIGEIARGF